MNHTFATIVRRTAAVLWLLALAGLGAASSRAAGPGKAPVDLPADVFAPAAKALRR